MPRATRETEIYRLDARHNHNLLTPAEREDLIKPFLPTPQRHADASDAAKSRSTFGLRIFLRAQIHALIYAIIHTIFSVYIRFRQAYHAVVGRVYAILYYHHRTPELIQRDLQALTRLPKHLSVILKLEDGGRGGAGLETLVNDIAEIAAWCASAGIPMLSIYEKTGVLKGYVPATHRAVTRKLASYFGAQKPTLTLRAPHVPSMESSPNASFDGSAEPQMQNLSILLISEEDGRDSIVDLTKTLTEMSQRGKLSTKDISMDLIDAELSESVMSDPDLLILFGPSVDLAGYPPWQIRLTEIFHVQDSQGVGYQVFLRALHNYGKAQMRFGR